MQINSERGEKIILLILMFSLIVGLVGLSGVAMVEKSAVSQYDPIGVVCREKAFELNEYMLEIEDHVDSLANQIKREVSGNFDITNTKMEHELTNEMRPLIKIAINDVKVAYTAYLRYNPNLTPKDSGVFISKNGGSSQELEMTDILAYDSRDIAHVGWYYVPMEYGSAMWLEPYHNENIDVYMISYVVPIYKDAKEFGVIGMDIEMSELIKKVDNISVYGDGFAYLQSQSGEILSSKSIDDSVKNDYQIASMHLANNMTLNVCVPNDKVYPVRYSVLYQVAMVGEILLLIISLTFICIVIWRKDENKAVSSRNNIKAGSAVLNILFVFILVCQIAFTIGAKNFIDKVATKEYVYNGNYDETIWVVADRYFEPYTFINENGDVAGFEVDLIHEIANRMGVNVQIDLLKWNDAKSMVALDKADVLLGLELISNRNDEDIIKTNYILEDAFVVLGKTPISSISELYGKKIASLNGATFIDAYGLEDNAVLYDTYEEEIESVYEEVNDYAIVRKNVADSILQKGDYHGVVQVYDMMESKLCMGVSAQKKDLLQKIDNVINEMHNDNTINDLKVKWLENTSNRSYLDIVMEHKGFYELTGFFLVIMLIAMIFMKVGKERDVFKFESETDALTQISNRRNGEREIKNLFRNEKYGMFCLFDVDKFKSINDTYGHGVGDKVLIAIGQCVKETFRDRDVVFRLGGDEFVAYAVGVLDENAGKIVIDRLMNAVDNISIPEMGDKKVSISLGATFYLGADGDTFDTVYKRADVATYESKEFTGNKYSFRYSL